MRATQNCVLSQNQRSMADVISRALPPSDYDLARAIGLGDPSGIDLLYVRHKTKVYSLCLRMTGNTTEAEDLTQEVFLQLLGKVGSFRGESQFTTWLHRFTINQVLMYFRRRNSRRDRFTKVLDESATTPLVKYSLGGKLIDRIALDAAVAKLPSGSRSVFLKFDVEGYSHDEIAGIFGCSVGNSKSQLHKARKKLRHLLTLNSSAAMAS
jgi:RNA polymerase sigma-70 factor (ECF subfamily)